MKLCRLGFPQDTDCGTAVAADVYGMSPDRAHRARYRPPPDAVPLDILDLGKTVVMWRLSLRTTVP